MRHFSDRREALQVPYGELRSKESLRKHLAEFHGDHHPADMNHETLRWNHNVIHDNDLSIVTQPHDHEK